MRQGLGRRTKIVATLGPKTREPEHLRPLLEAEVDVVRLNLAHDVPETHKRMAEMTRKEAEAIGRVVGVLVDLPGPKMRTGPVRDGSIVLEVGGHFVLAEEEVQGTEERVSTTVSGLAQMVTRGDEIFLADGQIVLSVQSVEDGDVHTEVVRRGLLRSRKGMHIPKAERAVEAFTKTDRAALDLGLELGADLIGLSFVRDAEDIRRVRDALPAGDRRPLLVAKIETRSAVDNIDEIVRESDVAMVARGDLGIQTPLSEVPLVQKDIIQACNRIGTPVITATQMLESMTHSPLPSRAEVADVANAVLDGTDALMLSEETAVGDFPAETVHRMAEIARTAERRRHAARRPREGRADQSDQSLTVAVGDPTEKTRWAVARATVALAEDMGATAILCPTATGSTPLRVARYRPAVPVIAMAENDRVLGALGTVWGVRPLKCAVNPESDDAEEAAHRLAGLCCEAGVVGRDALTVVVVGPPAVRTDSIHVVRTS